MANNKDAEALRTVALQLRESSNNLPAGGASLLRRRPLGTGSVRRSRTAFAGRVYRIMQRITFLASELEHEALILDREDAEQAASRRLALGHV